MRFQSFMEEIQNTGHLSDSTNLVVNPGPEGAALERTLLGVCASLHPEGWC